jgi:hypothetical protein
VDVTCLPGGLTVAHPLSHIIFKWSDVRTAIARAEIDIELRRDKNLPVP